MSVAVLDVREALLTLSRVISRVSESPAEGWNKCAYLNVGDREGVSLCIGEGVGLYGSEIRGESVPISTARSSVHARPQLFRYFSVSLSTTSSLVRWGTSEIRSTTWKTEQWDRDYCWVTENMLMVHTQQDWLTHFGSGATYSLVRR